jgi:hypothetical protein
MMIWLRGEENEEKGKDSMQGLWVLNRMTKRGSQPNQSPSLAISPEHHAHTTSGIESFDIFQLI